MTFDRELLRAPFVDMRAQLAAAGQPVPDVPASLAARVRSVWRRDLTLLGVDTSNADQVAGALAGLALGMKSAAVMNPDWPIEWYAQWVLLYETLEVVLDEPEPTDAEIAAMLHDPPSARVRTPWGDMLGWGMEAAADALAAGQHLDRFDLTDPGQLAALANLTPPEPPRLGHGPDDAGDSRE